jgi:hypothetical protein
VKALEEIFATPIFRAPSLYIGTMNWGGDREIRAVRLSDPWLGAVGVMYLYDSGYTPHLNWNPS